MGHVGQVIGVIGDRGVPTALACLVALFSCAATGLDPSEAPASPRPNIVTITTDDQARSTLSPEVMPNLYSKLVDRGTSFSDYIVTTPLCCPSRASYLTGQYGHNNGVLRNSYGDLRQKRDVLPVWLRRAGYSTAHVGKFMNAYPGDGGSQVAVAPGWDLWFNHLEKRRYYDWKASRNGKLIRYGSRNRDNATAVTTRVAAKWTQRLARRKAPFYMQVDYYAPHLGPGRGPGCGGAAEPLAKDRGRFADEPLPRPPNFNQRDVSTMPSFIRDRPRLTREQVRTITRHYRCAIESLYGVDRGIGRIHRAVRAAGELNRTVFVFTSDNGYFYGEHRIVKGKPLPYEENIRTILELRIPRSFRGGASRVPTSAAPAANIDLAPTLLELAGASPCRPSGSCRVMDGRSLMPIIDGNGVFPESRSIAVEGPDCFYDGVRNGGSVFIEYALGRAGECVPTEAELYELHSDPYQLDDLLPAPDGSAAAQLRTFLERESDRLHGCAGIDGRDAPTAGRPFCG